MKEIMTHKSGKFIFSREYDQMEIIPLLVRAGIVNETISDLPILPTLASSLKPELLVKSIHGTVSLEGNPLTEVEVKQVIDEPEDMRAFDKFKTEVRNIKNAYDFISDYPYDEGSFILTEEFIRQVHKIVIKDINKEGITPGQYRDRVVWVGDKEHGGVYKAPKCLDDIKVLMKAFVEWINSDDLLNENVFIRAFLAHYHFCLIHPFLDGNGRTARIIEAAILRSEDVKFLPKMLSNSYYKNTDGYYIAFRASEKDGRDITKFLEFCFKMAIESLDAIKKKVTFFIRDFVLKDFYSHLRSEKKIKARQYDLIRILLENDMLFNLEKLFEDIHLSILYRKVSKATARRDIKELLEKGIIVAIDKKEYILNRNILDYIDN